MQRPRKIAAKMFSAQRGEVPGELAKNAATLYLDEWDLASDFHIFASIGKCSLVIGGRKEGLTCKGATCTIARSRSQELNVIQEGNIAYLVADLYDVIHQSFI